MSKEKPIGILTDNTVSQALVGSKGIGVKKNTQGSPLVAIVTKLHMVINGREKVSMALVH